MSTRRKPEPLAPADALAANKLGVLWATLDQALNGLVEEFSPSSAAMLIWLSHWSPTGVVELARVVGLSQPACTRAADKLVDQGLVDKTVLSGKEIQLSLSAAGRRAAAGLQQRRLAACHGVLAALSPHERDTLDGLLDKLVQAPVVDRAYARHVCRFCDHAVCDGPACPVGCRATALEARAADPRG